MILWFAEEQVDVLGHEDVGVDVEVVGATSSFDDMFDDVFGLGCFEVRKTAVTTEGDEVELVRVLAAFEAQGHGWILSGGEGKRFVLPHECPLMR